MAKHVLRSEDVKKKIDKPTTFIDRGSEEPVESGEITGQDDTKQAPVDIRVDGLETFADEYGKFSIEVSQHINALNAKIAEIHVNLAQIGAIISQFNGEVSKITGDLYRTSVANEEFHGALAKALREIIDGLPATIDARITEILEIEPEENKEGIEEEIEGGNAEE